MIDLSSLVKTIQDASLSAVELVSAEHLKILDRYFETIEESENLNEGSAQRKSHPESLSHLLSDSADHLNDEVTQTLRPKTVTIQYPKETAKGFEIQNVDVPLLTLMPISMPQISELKFTSDLELSLDDNDVLKVSFPTKKKERRFHKNTESSDKTASAKLEIIFNDANMSDGLQKIIEGYEKALRAQIPG